MGFNGTSWIFFLTKGRVEEGQRSVGVTDVEVVNEHKKNADLPKSPKSGIVFFGWKMVDQVGMMVLYPVTDKSCSKGYPLVMSK